MIINSVNLNNFRNVSDMILLPDSEVNVIYGQNAQGKTNILEAIWLFTGCKSFRGSKDSEFIKFNNEFSKISLNFEDKIREKKAEIIISDKKKVLLNGVEKKSTSDFIGEFYAVIFSPSHLSLIKDGPNVRRKFLDTAICQLKPKYAKTLSAYRKIILQRNSLLKDIQYHSELYDVLDSWDEQLAKYSALIINDRIKYINLLGKHSEEIYSGISENKEKLTLKYIYAAENTELKDVNDIYSFMLEKIKSSRNEDILLKTTSVGPHRDDIEINIDGISARSFGSQGQQRSCALALKLGESEIIKSITGENPVALLDDVMSELDEKRQDYVLNHIKERQVFLTCCDPSQVLRLCKGKSFLIENGNLKEEK
ncbi:MAG: DNA replication/repair protein RecF [Clostridia bacterium]|nr:DNA replication/repair protein RecF [Clostridia bacterium]